MSRHDADRLLMIVIVNQKSAAVKAIPAKSTKTGGRCCGTFCVDARACCGVADVDASHALTLLRQHFLKRDAVFLNALVYSGCSAFRFPSARSD
jgi:hypothetical protein